MGSLKDRAFGGEPYRQPNYPDVPGHVAGSVTSAVAARRIAGHAKSLGAQILQLLGDHPNGLIADEVAAKLGMRQPYAARPRLAELHRRGEIIDSGLRRLGQSGISQAVWKIAPPLPNERGAA
jgi:hypothetical protein